MVLGGKVARAEGFSLFLMFRIPNWFLAVIKLMEMFDSYLVLITMRAEPENVSLPHPVCGTHCPSLR